jgi:glycosyl transferase family 25
MGVASLTISTMDAVQTWVINLDRAPDRLARVREQLDRLQMPFMRLPAVDARQFTPTQRALLDEAKGLHRLLQAATGGRLNHCAVCLE